MSTADCEHCEKASYVYDATCHACTVRSLSRMPRVYRQREYQRIAAEQGELTVQLLVQEVSAYYRASRPKQEVA